MKNKYWFRHLKNTIRFYFYVLLDQIFTLFKIFINVVCLLLVPVWLGPIYVITYISRAYKSKKTVERKVLRGDIWFWNQYRLY